MTYLGTYGVALGSCRDCNRHGNVFVYGRVCHMHQCLSTLAHNLAVAGGLRAAYDLGANPPSLGPGTRVEYSPGHYALIPDGDWKPGCGKAWEGR